MTAISFPDYYQRNKEDFRKSEDRRIKISYFFFLNHYPPGSNSRIASTDALFVVADDSSLEIENLSATVSSNAVDKVEAIIYVNTGRLTVDSFTTPASVTGLAIGPNATASQISITDSNIGKIAIDETNKDTGIYDEITNGNTSDAEITTGFDATTAEEFGNALKQFGRVRLMADFSIENDDIKVDANTASSELELNGEEYIIDLNTHTINSNVCWYLLSNTIVRISNGSLNFDIEYDTEHDPLSESTIILYEEAELYFDNVHFFSNITGLFMKDKQSGMVLDIRNSEIKAAGYYAIGTNANTPPHSQNLTLNIINSYLHSVAEKPHLKRSIAV